MDVPITYCPPGYAQGYHGDALTMQMPDSWLKRAGDNQPLDKLGRNGPEEIRRAGEKRNRSCMWHARALAD